LVLVQEASRRPASTSISGTPNLPSDTHWDQNLSVHQRGSHRGVKAITFNTIITITVLVDASCYSESQSGITALPTSISVAKGPPHLRCSCTPARLSHPGFRRTKSELGSDDRTKPHLACAAQVLGNPQCVDRSRSTVRGVTGCGSIIPVSVTKAALQGLSLCSHTPLVPPPINISSPCPLWHPGPARTLRAHPGGLTCPGGHTTIRGREVQPPHLHFLFSSAFGFCQSKYFTTTSHRPLSTVLPIRQTGRQRKRPEATYRSESLRLLIPESPTELYTPGSLDMFSARRSSFPLPTDHRPR
jgi:hypothetical protein